MLERKGVLGGRNLGFQMGLGFFWEGFRSFRRREGGEGEEGEEKRVKGLMGFRGLMVLGVLGFQERVFRSFRSFFFGRWFRGLGPKTNQPKVHKDIGAQKKAKNWCQNRPFFREEGFLS